MAAALDTMPIGGPKRLTVTVSRKHIMRGARQAVNYCPIALALQEQTGHLASVLNFHANIADFGYYRLSEKAVEFVSRFDTGKKVQPMRFVFKRHR